MCETSKYKAVLHAIHHPRMLSFVHLHFINCRLTARAHAHASTRDSGSEHTAAKDVYRDVSGDHRAVMGV
jgi:hypothetical protein